MTLGEWEERRKPSVPVEDSRALSLKTCPEWSRWKFESPVSSQGRVLTEKRPAVDGWGSKLLQIPAAATIDEVVLLVEVVEEMKSVRSQGDF